MDRSHEKPDYKSIIKKRHMSTIGNPQNMVKGQRSKKDFRIPKFDEFKQISKAQAVGQTDMSFDF